jgi:hypothetical protein
MGKCWLGMIILLAAACGEDRPPAPSAEEAEQLNEVEAMLNGEAPKQEGPASKDADPSKRSN